MTVAVVVDFPPGTTLEQYDDIIAKLGLKPQGVANPGQLFHWVAAYQGGVRFTDVWDSKEVFDRFAQEKMIPSVKEAGLPGPSNIEYHEVHNYLTANL